MARCDSIQTQLTAYADGELSRWQQWWVDRHLSQCAGCNREAAGLRKAARTQAALLRESLPVGGSDIDALRLRVRVQIAALGDEPSSSRARLAFPWKPVFAVAASLALVLSVATWQLGGASAVLVALDLVAPPKAVASKTDLFRDYMMIERLDALENFDSVNSIPIEGEEEKTSSMPFSWLG